MSNTSDLSSSPTPRSRGRRWLLAGLATAAVAAGALAWQAPAMAFGPGFGHHGGAMDPETMSRRIDAMTSWMLADIDASPEQRNRIAAIFKGAANDLAPLRERHRAARKEGLQLLSAPTIDRARLEQLRIEQMQLGDTASRRMLQAMTDAAEVLTPTQRAQLAQKWQEGRERRR